ncbi:MAG: LuxR C-terminal-related transcriptional regulator [Actinomycetota bacterium]|nr:LuxR C-terminal-related transcriptional regulator [Actinomycetota bacterium]
MSPTVPVLPASVDRFVGRAREVAEVDQALRRARLVNVTGPGGAGKTRLALEIARRRARKSSPVFLVDLSAISAAHRVPAAFADAVGVAGASSDAMPDVVRVLAGTTALLVVDNCEHVVDAVAPTLTALLEGCPKLRVLATSRQTLRMPGETVFPLGPLHSDEAVRLFVERAQAVRPDALAGAEAPVEEICRRLEGLPLALELAAARVSALSPTTILSRLEGQLDVLAGEGREGPTRHHSLRETIEWSFELLSRKEQEGFARLAVFPGSFSLEAAEAAAGVDLDVLDSLVTKSLVSTLTVAGDELRYRLLDTLRSYARERLLATGQEDELRDRHLRFFVARAEAAHGSGALGGSGSEVRALSDELDNLRLALAWSVDHDPPAGLSLLGTTREVWFLRAQTEGRAWATRLLGLHSDPDRARALGLLGAGQLAAADQDHAAARPLLLESIELAERLGAAEILAAACHRLGLSAMLSRDVEEAERSLARSVELFGELGQAQGVGRGLGILGMVRLNQGDLAGANQVLTEALATLGDCDDPWGQGQVLMGLGLAAKSAGDVGPAVDLLSQAVAMLVAAGDATILGVALVSLAALTVSEDPRRALRLAGAAVGCRERIGGRHPLATREELEAVRRACAESLGAEAAEAEWDAGLALTPADSAALVAGRPARVEPSALTARQLEAARLVADGLTNAQIACELHLSERTVENHVFNSLTQLGLHNRVQLATWVTERGLR